MLPIMLAALAKRGVAEAHLGLAEGITPDIVDPLLQASGLEVEVHSGAAAALAASAFALVGAGTATLDCAVARRPMVIMGKVHPWSAPIARILVRTPHFGLPNLILERRAFPELIQSGCTAEAVSNALSEVMEGDYGSTFMELDAALGKAQWPGTVGSRLDALLGQH